MSSSPRFKDKVAIVTGAANGIGRSIATRFAREGAHVIVADVNGAGADSVAGAITAESGSARGCKTDVAVEQQVQEMVAFTMAEFGRLDILVNNAGITNAYQPLKVERHILDGDLNWWNTVIGINLTGAFLCSLHACRVMVHQHSGVIINLSSGGASKAHRGMVAYDAAKGGIEAMTRAFALDLAPYGVRVNTLVPGSIDTSGLDLAQRMLRGQNIPLGRVGESDDLAGPAMFLASDDARYVTGHCLFVDGGMLIQQRSATVDIFPLSAFPKVETQP